MPGARTGLFGAAVIVAGGVLAAGQDTARPTFHVDTRTVAIYATVQDGAGRLVPDLGRDDFRVFVDDVPAQIVQFSADPQPLTVALMIDTSQVSGNSLGSHRAADRERTHEAIRAFVDALRPDDRVRIGSFGLEIAIGATLTRDWNEVDRVLREELWFGGGTPLWQALVAGMQSIETEPGRRVVLALTNGIDTGRLPGFVGRRSNVDDYATRLATMVYAVRLPVSSNHWDELADDLEDVAEASGAGHFDVPVDADVRDAFTRIAEELRHQYLIGFVPDIFDGQVHRIDVRSSRPGLIVRARRTFVAGGQP
jgi:Ca-activated chloride channel family protein